MRAELNSVNTTLATVRANYENVLADIKAMAKLLGLSYSVTRGNNLEDRLAVGEYGLLLDVDSEGGIAGLLAMIKRLIAQLDGLTANNNQVSQ